MSVLTLNLAALDPTNLSADLAQQIRDLSARGALPEGARLPSSRTLARELSVSRGTVVNALESLIAEGYLESRAGSGTFVAKGCSAVAVTAREDTARHFDFAIPRPDLDQPFTGRYNFQSCRPCTATFPRTAWRRAMADAAGRRPASDYGNAQGEVELRAEIAAYLCRARGLDVSADQILITHGALHAMHILARVFLAAGDEVAFEDPGYPLARQMFEVSGANIRSVSVDDHGLCVDQLPTGRHRVRCVYVTPSHQFPTGERLSLERRHALVRWANTHNALIVEDDYDGEFRYDVPPLPPMAAMTNSGAIVYCGTFSKTLFPSLRLGFAAGAPELIEAMARYRAMTDYQTSTQSQLALALFMQRGEFERHVYRMRRQYAANRKTLVETIQAQGLDAHVSGTDSGLNAVLRLGGGLRATDIATSALENDVLVTPLSRYQAQVPVRDSSLVLGYAALSEQEIAEGVGRLVDTINSISS